MVSDQGGKSNFIAELERRGIRVAKDDVRLDTLIAVVKEREAEGYAYEGADASFELLARNMLNPQPEFFKVESFRCLVERRFDANGMLKTVSEAVVKVEVDGEVRMSVAEGMVRSTRSISRCARIWGAFRPRSRILSWSISRCVSSMAARRQSHAS